MKVSLILSLTCRLIDISNPGYAADIKTFDNSTAKMTLYYQFAGASLPYKYSLHKDEQKEVYIGVDKNKKSAKLTFHQETTKLGGRHVTIETDDDGKLEMNCK